MNRKGNVSMRLVALLCTLVLMVGLIPASALPTTAKLGGDFPWTATKKPMLIEEIMERDGFIDGIWFPWFDGGNVGHSLTGNEVMVKYQGENWSKVALDTVGADKIYREIYNLKAMGYNLLGYGGSIYDEGVIFDDYGDVLGVKQEFLDNARRLLNMCREIGMPVMWTIHFHSSSAPGYYGIEAYDIFAQKYVNPVSREHYMERFVRPVCKMLAEYKDILALVAIADEPENEINDAEKGDHFGSDRDVYGVNLEDKITFMSLINDVVKEELPDVARTVASNDIDKTIYGGFDMDLMGHNVYHNNCAAPDIKEYKTDAPIILTEYNVGHDLHGNNLPDYDLFTTRLIQWRQTMMDKGYRGGVQWCWGTGGIHSRTAYYLLDTKSYDSSIPNTDFVSTVGALRHYIDDYRAEYRGETVTLDQPVLYCNEGGGYVEWIPSRQATKVDILRSTDGGKSWTYVVKNGNQDDHLVMYIDENGELQSKEKCQYIDKVVANSMYKIVVRDNKGNTAESEPNNVAGVEQKYKKATTKVVIDGPIGIGRHYNTSSQYKLYSFSERMNRPITDSVNLIQNGSFETNAGDWGTGNFLGAAQVITDSTAPDGKKSLYFDATGTNSGKWYSFKVSGLKQNTDYVFSAWVKGDFISATNAGNASVGVVAPDTGKFMYGASNASRDNNQLFPTVWGGQWHLRSVAFNSKDMTEVSIALYGVDSHLYVDDMALFENGQGIKYVGTNMKSDLSMDFDVENTVCAPKDSVIQDATMDATDYWQTGYGWRNGFVSIQKSTLDYGNSLKYTASDDPYGLYYIKWIPVKQNTWYTFTFDMKVLKEGRGYLALIDDRNTGPRDVLAFECDPVYGTDWVRYTMRVNTRGFEQVGIAVCDLGGSALYDNIRLFEEDKGIGNQDLFVSSVKTTNKVTYGAKASVTVNATGDGLKYKWYYKSKNGSKFEVATSYTGKTYSVDMNESRDGRQVYCVVTDKYGNTRTTATTTLTLKKTALKITTQPKTTYIKMGATGKVTVKAAGDGLTYTWYYKNAGATKYTKASATGSSYSVKMSSTNKNRTMYCVIKDVWGNKVTTNTITVRQAVSVTTQPKTTYVKKGATAKFTVKASGDGLKYAWYVKNAGASKFTKVSTTATLSVKLSSTTKNRQVYCVVTDKYGKTAQSNTVYLRESVSVTTQPKTAYAKKNATAKFTVKASGDGLKYTWYYKNAGTSKFSKASTTSATYSVKLTATTKNRQVYCVVTDKYGNKVTTKTVYLRESVSITTQPKTVTVKKNATAKVSVKASGDGLTYTWYYKNANGSKFVKASAKSASYSVKMTATTKNRKVYCVVKDKYGNTVKTVTVTLKMK